MPLSLGPWSLRKPSYVLNAWSSMSSDRWYAAGSEDLAAALDVVAGEADVLRVKNRFASPTPAGYRDVTLLCRRRLGEGVFVVEVQFCLAELLDIEKRYASHKVYEEFRDYFGGADDAAVSKRVAVVDALG